MFEFAAGEFDSMMLSYPAFKKVADNPTISGGSLVLGVEQLTYSDGKTTIQFTSSAGSMQLVIARDFYNKKMRDVRVNDSFTDFGEVREIVKDTIEALDA